MHLDERRFSMPFLRRTLPDERYGTIQVQYLTSKYERDKTLGFKLQQDPNFIQDSIRMECRFSVLSKTGKCIVHKTETVRYSGARHSVQNPGVVMLKPYFRAASFNATEFLRNSCKVLTKNDLLEIVMFLYFLMASI